MADTILKITDQIIKSVDKFTFYDLVDGSIMAMINQLNNVNLNQTQDTTWYLGKQGVRLAGFDTNKNLEVTAQNGFIDLATMGLQTGADIIVYDGATNFIEAPYIDELTTADGLKAKTTYAGYSNVVGAEIEFIYKLHGSGVAGAARFKQGAVASASEFAYDPLTKEITLPLSVFESGEVLLAQYKYKALGTSISSDTEHFSKSAKVVIDVTTTDICTDTLTHSQFVLPKAKIDGTFSIAMGDSPAVHNITLSATPSVCFGASKNLFTYQLVTPYIA